MGPPNPIGQKGSEEALTVSVKIVSAVCGNCNYQVDVGMGSDHHAAVRVHWTPAGCASCGVVSINVHAYGSDEKPTCNECGRNVSLYLDWGPELDPNSGRPCPVCGDSSLHFTPKVDGV